MKKNNFDFENMQFSGKGRQRSYINVMRIHENLISFLMLNWNIRSIRISTVGLYIEQFVFECCSIMFMYCYFLYRLLLSRWQI